MTETTREMSVQDWVNSEDIIALWIIKVPLICDVVEVWQVSREELLYLALLEHVLLLIPEPLGIYLSKVLHHQTTL